MPEPPPDAGPSSRRPPRERTGSALPSPAIRLLLTFTFVLAVVAAPIGAWRWLAAAGLVLAFAVGLSGLAPADLFRRWLGFGALIAFFVLVIAWRHPARASFGFGGVAAFLASRNSLAVLAVLTLAGTTPAPRLLAALRRLGVPAALVETLQFMDRYAHVLRDELRRMRLARRSRSFGRRGLRAWLSPGGLLGPLLLRAMERGERVHAAMLARGWDGTWRTLDAGDAP